MNTHMGAVPALARRTTESHDALLAHTGPAARAILYRINQLPKSLRVEELNRVLGRFEPGLPARLRRTVEYLHREGMPVDAAMERALTLSLADGSIEKAKQLGRKARDGQLFPMGGLGAETPEGEDAGDVAARMFQGIACSPDVSAATTNIVGRNEGADAADATQIGFAVARGFALCPPGTVPEPPVAPPPETEERSVLMPVLLGVGALAAVGGVVWFVARKK